jgi:hypothetical protein
MLRKESEVQFEKQLSFKLLIEFGREIETREWQLAKQYEGISAIPVGMLISVSLEHWKKEYSERFLIEEGRTTF